MNTMILTICSIFLYLIIGIVIGTIGESILNIRTETQIDCSEWFVFNLILWPLVLFAFIIFLIILGIQLLIDKVNHSL